MRLREFASYRAVVPTPRATHKFLTSIWLDPLDADAFFKVVDASGDYEIYNADRTDPEVRVFLIASSTEQARDRLRLDWM